MADFRRIVLALAVLTLLVGVAGAQTLTCNATTVPTQARSEGITELMGDIVLTCTGGAPITTAGQLIPQANIVEWSNGVPWPTIEQVEQDLLLSRLIIEIGEHRT